MSLTIRKYHPNDYEEIQRRKWDRITYMHFPDVKTVANTLGKGQAYTMVSDEGIVACAGIVPLWKGTGEGWAITSELVEKYRISFAKSLLRYLFKIIQEFKYTRIQTTVLEHHQTSKEWLEWMGFTNEGLMRKYIGDNNYYRYALVREG